MKTFTDGAGRMWTLTITVDALKRVQGLVGVNLADIAEPQRDSKLPLLTELETDLVLLCDVIFALVKPQAEQAGVSDGEFGRALGGEAIAAAHNAFWQELADFFRRLPNRQAHVRAIEKQHALVKAAVTAAEQRIETLIVEDQVARVFGDSSSSSPASPGSIPDR